MTSALSIFPTGCTRAPFACTRPTHARRNGATSSSRTRSTRRTTSWKRSPSRRNECTSRTQESTRGFGPTASGDAAVRVDPENPDAIAAGVREALARRDELVSRGLAHARPFTWLETGRIHLQGYAEAL